MQASTAQTVPPVTDTSPRAVGIWLAICCLMVFAMMIIGAITRLTESGLSMVEWRPLMGWIPPTTHDEWERVFALYKQTSQYHLMNKGMELSQFQQIFWWEFIHRLWGRTIGLVFALPFFWFLITGRMPKGYVKHGFILLFLGGLQGVVGWWMVKSGFVDRTEVSQYRLATHLGMALFILAYLFWLAMGLLSPVPEKQQPAPRGFRRLGAWAHAVIFFTAIAGAFVAGARAGFIYNTWPLMGDGFVPSEYFFNSPWWINFFENAAAIQFNHRILAYTVFAVSFALWLWSWRVTLAPRARLAVNTLMLAVFFQICLGIFTLLTVVWLPLGVLHQMGAVTTFLVSIWLMKELRGFRT